MAHTQAQAQVGTQGYTQAEVAQGAQACVAFWEAQGEEAMVQDAKARLARVLEGTASEVDIEGALDWLDYEGEEYEEDEDEACEDWASYAEAYTGEVYAEVAQAQAHIDRAIAEYRWSEEASRIVAQEWLDYMEEEATAIDIAEVLALYEECEERGIEAPEYIQAVWCVADAR